MIKRVLALSMILAVQSAPVLGAEQTILVLGDSLSSGYGLGAEQSWVDLLENRLEDEAYGYRIVNASIPGDTSAGGAVRLPRLLEAHSPSIVIIELGGNDGLRGQPIPALRDNLERMIMLVLAEGALPVLTGIQIPPNYGPAYTSSLAGLYPDLAAHYDIPLVGFLLDGVALDDELMQSDGMHPNAAGQKPLFENVWAVLAGLL